MSQVGEPQYAITANDLRNGAVVYLRQDGNWTECLDECRVFTDRDLDRGTAAGRDAEAVQWVVGAYEIEVVVENEKVMPVRYRERIRAFGPSTHADFIRAEVPGHLSHPDGVVAVRFGGT